MYKKGVLERHKKDSCLKVILKNMFLNCTILIADSGYKLLYILYFRYWLPKRKNELLLLWKKWCKNNSWMCLS